MKNKNKKSKLSSLIESDRLLLSKDTSSLILYDLKKLLENYFTQISDVKINVSAEKDSYFITITALASAIKSCQIIK